MVDHEFMGKRGASSEPKAKGRQAGSVSSNGFGTVLVLLQDAALVKKLVQLFKRTKLEAKTYSNHRQLQTDKLPNHPACLVACISGCSKCGLLEYEELKQNGIYLPVVFLAKTTDFRLAVKAMRAGAEDLLPLPVDNKQLLASIRSALDRSRRFLETCSEQISMRQRAESLTEREREIVRLVVGGMLNKEIAAHLNLALVTVKVHRGKAMRKLGARTSAELARLARILGLKAGAGETALPFAVPGAETLRAGTGKWWPR